MTTPEPTRCPACGTVAAEFVCHLCKLPRDRADAQARANEYADYWIKRDKEARHSGSGHPDQDRDTFGRPLKPGS